MEIDSLKLFLRNESGIVYFLINYKYICRVMRERGGEDMI